MKSIYFKFVTIYTIIIVMGFLIFGTILNNLTENYFISQKQTQLVREAEKIATGLALWYITGFLERDRLRFEINFLRDYLNASILMINRNANVVLNSDEQVFINDSILQRIRDKVFSGNIAVEKTLIGTIVKKEYLIIGYPVVINNQVVSGLLLITSTDDIRQTLRMYNRIIWLITLFEVILVLIITYALTQKIINPIKKLASVSRKIAEGDFSEKIPMPLNSNDEIGELIASFNYMTEKLENLEMMRKSFISNVSHELRSPLTSIRGFIEGILDRTIPDEKRDFYLNLVREEVIKLNNLINQLLELSRLEWGKINLNLSTFKIYSVIAEELIKFEKRIEEKKIEVFLEVNENLMVKADRDLISRVVHNLLDNAIKYNKVGGKIYIYSEVENGKAYITIQDTGIGIPEKLQKLIWERFYKVDESRSLEKGVGLGLSIVKEIIKLHKQNIWVESEEGVGTKFTFTLDLK
ncbi:integral membrane sensor signal transduction histidine kinase [Caldicellulosiruptor saccharolyticus DSM 8903]|uniref:histidine kinase n=1 Tax=Caldicellulosiruptor saccharolyticus (strain ATCC 43494 / DSM 8903 / Tp8T 6331) TaxID=351627 RepID=A4XL02_CALS8|nr:HAMP domain-containing sensor histidine kinase [Caldicellulosiruptor saccharolyticus]ABP67587.1 integral membrane sensor signal transduction histidine kinase [Caldicellulosiruptor saccharolyticus DSM 8903]